VRPTLALAALALIVAGGAGAVSFDAAPTSCETTGIDSSCGFACDLGDLVMVVMDAQDPAAYVAAQAQCGSATVACAGTGGCTGVSSRTSVGSMGTCTSVSSVGTTTCIAWVNPVGVTTTEGASCTASGEGSSCYYVCVAGQSLFASAYGPKLFTSAATACGGASAVCTGSVTCYQRSAWAASSLVAVGACRAFSGSTTATCGMVV
jgi:hypothetical protein